MSEKTTLTKDEKLTAMALFTMAKEHYVKASEFEQALHDLLEMESEGGYCGHFSDEMCNGGNFDRAFKKSGLKVEKAAAPEAITGGDND